MNAEIPSTNFSHEIGTMDMDSVARLNSGHVSYGKLLVLGNSRYGKFRVVIGPHWYVSIIGFSLLTLIGIGILMPLWASLSIVLRILFILVFGFTLLMYVLIFLSNPGIIPQKPLGDPNEDVENKTKYSCTKCLSLREQKAYHCEDCDVCIEGWDHHCVWVGKCIGKQNLTMFYVFVAAIPIFFVFVMFMSCVMSFDMHKHRHVN